MQKNLQVLIGLLSKMDLDTLLQHYVESNEAENTAQLGFLYKQAQIKLSSFDFYQELASSFIGNKGIPTPLISKIKTNNILSFFTPALQIERNFNKTDSKQRNVLHYLFSSNLLTSTFKHPPFNYLRSMMLFASNLTLSQALCQRDQKNLTPIEAYLFTNKNLSALASYELTALFALIEIENKQHTIDQSNYSHLIQTIKTLGEVENSMAEQESQRILLISIYYSIPVKQVLSDLN